MKHILFCRCVCASECLPGASGSLGWLAGAPDFMVVGMISIVLTL